MGLEPRRLIHAEVVAGERPDTDLLPDRPGAPALAHLSEPTTSRQEAAALER
ncbi:hypothetical protein ATJ97_3902 [Georgenia soli]|uniref:Uncharacterized protein n=1 Tax=Georgenia soli TaxID=638953 RepID=A0A2A9ESW0_9MICO|nr:hypothetical protein [Georgenia soli]PFG41350.1 hypothetical protein ATJ97_3902 [Georgenia soli]